MKVRIMLFGSILCALLLAVLPMTLHARAVITDFSVDRTTITRDQDVIIDITTNADTNFVFAMVGGGRIAAERVSEEGGERTWILRVSPTISSTINVFANSSNSEAGAVRIRVPVTVIGETGLPDQTAVPIADIPPLGIHHISETPARAANEVQLTVITGTAVENVWTRIADNRYVQGERISRDRNTQTWVINYRPTARVPHTMQVWANRSFNWPGATTMEIDVQMNAPHVPVVTPLINNVTVSPTVAVSGTNVTLRIRTNQHVENVWIRDIDGVEREARRLTSSALQRNWEIVITPFNPGTVTIFANTSRRAEGAAQHSETINVSAGAVQIVASSASNPARNTNGNLETLVQVTTNNHATQVRATIAGGLRTYDLTRISGTNQTNQVWEARVESSVLPITVRAGSGTQASEVTQQITVHTGVGGAAISNFQVLDSTGVAPVTIMARNSTVTLRVFTNEAVNEVFISDSRGTGFHRIRANRVTHRETTAGVRVWEIAYTVPDIVNTTINFTVDAHHAVGVATPADSRIWGLNTGN
jgi:hypothetical protein